MQGFTRVTGILPIAALPSRRIPQTIEPACFFLLERIPHSRRVEHSGATKKLQF